MKRYHKKQKTMKSLPILKYDDLRSLMCLDHHYHINGVVVDAAALENYNSIQL